MGIQYTAGDALSSAFIPTVFRLCNLVALREYLKQYCQSGEVRVLDAGCGDGIHALYLAEAGIKGSYLGIDVSTKFTGAAWRAVSSACRGLSADFRVMDVTKISGETLGDFNAVICLTALEHIAGYRQAISKMSQVLAAGGSIFITVPSSYTWFFSFGKHAYHYFTAGEIEAAAAGCGLTVRRSYRLGGAFSFFFDLLYSWLMAVVSQFTDSAAFVAAAPRVLKKTHHKLVYFIQRIDAILPVLESGYAYVFVKS